MGNSKLMAPLFCDGFFNRSGRKMRAVLEKTVSNGMNSYQLWRSAGKPDRDFATTEDDKYYLYAEINGRLAPIGLTHHDLVTRCGSDAVDEKYGGPEARERYFDDLRKNKGQEAVLAALDKERVEIERLGSDPTRQADYIEKFLDERVQVYLKSKETGGKTFPDFIGALVINDLDKCVELSDAYKAVRRAKEKARAAKDAEEEKAFCEEQNWKAEQKISDALQAIRNGGVLKNDTVQFYKSRYEASSYSIVLYLMRQYHIEVPLRTQGWIKDRLLSATIRDGRCKNVQYLRSKKGRCSEAVFKCMDQLAKAVVEQQSESKAVQDTTTDLSNYKKGA